MGATTGGGALTDRAGGGEGADEVGGRSEA